MTKSATQRLAEAVPFGVWLTPREIRKYAYEVDIPHGTMKEAIRNLITQKIMERRPIHPVALQKDKRRRKGNRTFRKNTKGTREPLYQYRRIMDYGDKPRRKSQRKLTDAQALYVLRNPDGLTATQLAKFLPVSEAHLRNMILGTEKGRHERLKRPEYNKISDDELRTMAFPGGAMVIEKLKTLPKSKEGRRRPQEDPEDRWDLTRFG